LHSLVAAATVAALILAGCATAGDDVDGSQGQGDGGAQEVRKAVKAQQAEKAKQDKQDKLAKKVKQATRAKRDRESSNEAKVRLAAPAGGDVDCGAFSNQAEAQKRLTGGDPYGLDGDGDGLACSSLPCPCSKAKPKPGAAPTGAPPSSDGLKFRAEVASVTDGDTLDLITPSGRNETVRLIGIDTPEVYGGVECGGPVASATMKRLATDAAVTVRTDPTQDLRDRYGRLLAYVNKGSLDLGKAMISRGLASAYVYDTVFLRFPGYDRAEQRAKDADRGSWDHCNLSPG